MDSEIINLLLVAFIGIPAAHLFRRNMYKLNRRIEAWSNRIEDETKRLRSERGD